MERETGRGRCVFCQNTRRKRKTLAECVSVVKRVCALLNPPVFKEDLCFPPVQHEIRMDDRSSRVNDTRENEASVVSVLNGSEIVWGSLKMTNAYIRLESASKCKVLYTELFS